MVNYTRSQEEADTFVSELTAVGRNAIAVRADVSKSEEVKGLFEAAAEAFDTSKDLAYAEQIHQAKKMTK